MNDLTEVKANEIAKIEVDSNSNYIRVTWLQHVNGAALRQVLVDALTYSREEALTNWLCDMRKLEYMEMADQNWVINHFFPNFNKSRKYSFAYVVLPSFLELMSSHRIENKIEENPMLSSHIEVKVFSTIDFAKLWLSHNL